MNRDRIDKIGVSTAVTYFCRGGYINPHIAFDDKIAVWDGTLEIHKSKDSLSSKDIDFDIKVQVKSSERDSNNFPPSDTQKIKVSDLRHYNENGGTLLIKVLVGRNKSQVYFAFLSKIELNHLLEDCTTEQEEKSINVYKAPKDITEVVRKLRTMHLQGKHNLISAEQIADRCDFSLTTTVGPIPKSENPYVWMATHPVDILISVPEFEEPFYLKEGPSYISTRNRIVQPVSIDGQNYFDSFEVEVNQTGLHIYIGDFFSLHGTEFDKEKKGAHVSVTPNSSSILQYIDEIKFALMLHERKNFTLGNYTLNCPEISVPNEQLKILHENLEYAQSIVRLFRTLGIEPDFDRNSLTQKEHKILELLINHYLTGKPVVSEKFKQQIYTFTIGNYKLGIAVHEENGEFHLVDINKCKAFRCRHSDDKMQEFPIFSYCFHKEILVDNLDYSNFIQEYEARYTSDAEDYLENVNLDGLALLNIYDKTSNKFFLKRAKELFEWLYSKEIQQDSSSAVYFINIMQCKYRNGDEFTEDEILHLKEISTNQDFSLVIFALLNDTENVRRLWYSYDENQQQNFQIFPIYTIIKKVIS